MNSASSVTQYAYAPGADIISSMTNTAGFSWQRVYEQNRDLIARVENRFAPDPVSAFDYSNDAVGKRTQRIDSTPALSVTNRFGYNARSEVTSAVMYTNEYSYVYDDIGNWMQATADAATSLYGANTLNQYVTVTNSGVNVPMTYDFDGNMTRNGAWYHYWDGENNMKVATPVDATNGSLRVENGYDYMKRRVIKTVTMLTGYEPPAGNPPMPGNPGEWVPLRTTQYVWDGWNIAAEITVDENDGTTNVTRYVWGLDLSGSVQGAGGVGGLIAVIRDDGSVYFPCYDANGNISEYVDESGTVRAHREYDAFGNTTVATGALVHELHFWFSTKYLDEETWNYVYQQRQYVPPLGRWASRDPLEEEGGINPYGILANALMNDVDVLGQWSLIYNGSWEKSEIDKVTLAFDDLKAKMPLYLVRLRQWMVAATRLPAECAYKSKFQQELTSLYQILAMMQDGLNSATSLNIYKTNMNKNTDAKGGFPWSGFPFYLGNTFNGKIILNTNPANSFTDWTPNFVRSTIFHELSHVAGVPKDDGNTGMWTDYAHRVTSIAPDPAGYSLVPIVSFIDYTLGVGHACCPRLSEWIPSP